MYGLIRTLLFRLPPEPAHNLALNALDLAHTLGLLRALTPDVAPCPVRAMGLEFPNPVGLAAGLDKNADHLDALGDLGFGFIEVGTVTPRPQPGNPKPRLFRLPEHQAIINRMGFNNEGLEHLLTRVRRRRYQGILGINVGKNKDTPNEDSERDYRAGIEAVYPVADYITVNVSSPNTPGLRDLQFGDSLKRLLSAIKEQQGRSQQQTGRYVPIAVKIAPDMDEAGIRFVAGALLETGLDGVIATNTTIRREAVAGHRHGAEAGGLSGAPVRDASLSVIRGLYAELGDRLPIIGVGGITDGESAAEKVRAGARLVQLYTGFIYRGPTLIGESVEAIRRALTAAE
ncbi:quinone-dependent dihydroorotate dehydrogenase [Marinobacter lutaoensis]|jgi:dihydroorotate dehydrogenase|uniref:Dihydroorotate dehydrogenase (quinone) n=1 Tax=Marinobacter lutaoensis TaxID=135739 RepID=A0A1V2DUC9_9GAMM|nr:quinone-dependent dihydroorotate dehydrogenase [Marinobacter lutaoensis]MBE01791.1 quinone-dependent dihydroorotate dehydrogenase [Marinobacter sp.]MBI42061.1 quinone-dependent dihydroorotate dehydrogenase [Oceanospirillales bacterium]NVD36189.1 quinone-dependent dihydroorotate dehydrogenase [Marinobacter lutaoensis]ONF43931.1 dihydroorotate dehydrogenase (quinone) [Marinobacter lutaoensis]|tara:strand:+ start:817 stop:1848 length:1032 start_codon:yes stop_codon:yes gene_type:complete